MSQPILVFGAGGNGGVNFITAQQRLGAALRAAGAVPKISPQCFGERVDFLTLMEVENTRSMPHYKQDYRAAWMAER